jgi:hypothetical protein
MKLAALTLALASLSAQAGDWHAPKQNPDNFSNAEEHFLLVGFLPGIFVGTAWPDMHPVKRFAWCSVPGLIHEFEPSKGNVWSGRDLLVNSVGCGLGLWAATGFYLGTTPAGGVRVTYSVSFQ